MPIHDPLGDREPESTQFRVSAWTPAVEISQRVVVPATRSRMNRFVAPFVSPGTRFVAHDANSR